MSKNKSEKYDDKCIKNSKNLTPECKNIWETIPKRASYRMSVPSILVDNQQQFKLNLKKFCICENLMYHYV